MSFEITDFKIKKFFGKIKRNKIFVQSQGCQMPLFDFPMKKNSIWTQNVVIKQGHRLFKSIRTYSNRSIY